jgi:hypothetical protein
MFKITNKKLEKDILTIQATIPLRKIASRPKVKIKTQQIIEKISDEYTIISILKEDMISNSNHQNSHNQSGEWIFKIKKARSNPPKKPTSAQKPSTKRSIRGRIS